MALFAAALVGAILRGRAGRALRVLRLPLDGRLDVRGPQPGARRGFAALPLLPRAEPVDRRSGSGSGSWSPCSLCLGPRVAVLALAREVGMLRLRLGPAAALEIPEEGPRARRAAWS